MPDCIIRAVLLSMVVTSISFFITHSQLLEKHRKKLWQRSEFFGMLIDCSYCLGHWIAVPLLIMFPMRLFDIFWPADYVMTWLVISWMAGVQSLVASRLWGE